MHDSKTKMHWSMWAGILHR